MFGRRAVGIAHAEIDHVLAPRPRRGLHRIHLGENVGRKPPDTVEVIVHCSSHGSVAAVRQDFRSPGKYMSAMADETKMAGGAIPTLEDWQHWTLVMGRAQQMMMEFWAESLKTDQPFPVWSRARSAFGSARRPRRATRWR